VIGFSTSGSTDSTEKWLRKLASGDVFSALDHFGQEGVMALAAATPIDSGETSNSWSYEIVQNGSSYSIIWGNTHIVDGRPIAVLLQMGHGTRNGGYVQGRDYINPAMRPIFDRIANEAWRVVTAG
jgi:hypothetical protein